MAEQDLRSARGERFRRLLPPAATWVLVAMLLAGHGGMALTSLWQKSATIDELTHLPAGLAMVATGEPRLNPQHPPLLKLLAGAAASLARPALPLEGSAYRQGEEWRFGFQTLFASGNDDLRLLRLGRLPTVLLSMLCGLVLFRWSQLRSGDLAGLCCLCLYTCSPSILAHARWVTTDIPVACAWTVTLFLWWRWQQQLATSRLHQLAIGLALGLALAIKFSAVVLLPAMVGAELLSRRRPPRLRTWLVIAGVAALTVSLCYLRWDGLARYLTGLRTVNLDHQAGYEYYLGGQLSETGFPHYFLLAFLVKSALPGLVLMLSGLVAAALSRSRWRDDIYLWLPALLWLLVMSLRADNIGVRYLLPIYPLLFVLAGSLATVSVGARRSVRAGLALLAVLAALQVAVALLAYPNYLSFFNRAAGGRAGGLAWLDDSNVDWGQDLRQVAPRLAAYGEGPCWIAPFFPTELPASYGLACQPMGAEDWRHPEAGVYLVSAHLLIRVRLWCAEQGGSCDWLGRYQPAEVIGGSLYLFVIDSPVIDPPVIDPAEAQTAALTGG